MGKMVAPDRGAREVEIRTEAGATRYRQDKTGLISVENPAHAKRLKEEGFFEASLMGATTNHKLGHDCQQCGFSSWFKLCSRCGATNE